MGCGSKGNGGALFYALLGTLLPIPMLVGYGALLVRLALGREQIRELGVGELALGGFLPCAFIAIVANFLLPLHAALCGLALAGGWLALALHRRELQLPCGASIFIAVVALLGLIFAGGAFVNGFLFDTGLYHYQAILWQHESRVPLGLANLHGRLGFNTIWFSICALLWLPGLGPSAALSVNSALGTVFFVFLLEPFLQSGRVWRDHLGLVLITLTFFWLPGGPGFGKGLMFSGLGSPEADMPAMIFIVAAFLVSCTLALEGLASPRAASRWLLVLTLALLAVTTKLSALPVLLLPAWLAAAALFKGYGRDLRKVVARGFAISCVMLGVWIARSLALSGCLVYPSSFACIPAFPWSVSPTQADYDADLIKAWSRTPGPLPEQVLGSWDWFPAWLARTVDPMTRLLAGCVVAGALLWLAARPIRALVGSRLDSVSSRIDPVLPCLVVALLGLGFCFVLAPSPRFAYGFLIMTALLCLYGGLAASGLTAHLARWSRPLLLLAALSLAPGLLRATKHLILQPRAHWPVVPAVAIRENRNWQDEVIYTPVTGEQCWGAPRPCAVTFDPRLTFSRLGPWPLMQGGHKDSMTR